MAAATLDSIADTISKQGDTIAKQGESITALTAENATLKKSLEGLPADYSKIVASLPAVPIDHAKAGMWGFDSFGDFLGQVRLAGENKSITPKMQKNYSAFEKAIAGANETTGSEGGWLTPPEFSTKLFARLYSDSALLGKCDNYTVSGNTMIFPRSAETSRVTGSRWGGVQVYFKPEGGTATASKPSFGTFSMTLKKLMGFAAMTDELMNDQSVMPQYMLRAFSDEFDFFLSDQVVRGTGGNQMTGITSSACKIAQAAESGQLAATINAQNVVKMWSRLWAPCRKNAVWLYNQDIEPQLLLMTLGIGTAGLTVYMPPGGLSGSPYGTLLGRPMIPIEQANTLGTEGDLMLVDLTQYVTINKGGMNNAQSIHFYFDTDQTAFRMTMRIDGQPWWSAPLTPYKGTATQSCMITLATRS